MTEDKDALPSDTEDGGLKPQEPGKRTPPPPPVDEETERDPSEQPS